MELQSTYLNGQLLIAMPGLSGDNFSRSVVYICAHSEDGAMGLIINKQAPNLSMKELLVQLDVIPEDRQIRVSEMAGSMHVHQGGPVETGRGFVLHSSDYHLESSTLPVNADISLTATVEVLKAIADGRGPENALLALGYAGWAPGQLESEIQANGWLTAPASQEIIFQTRLEDRYDRALALLGITPALLSSEAGHA
ncbi:hypothetical protein HDIA_1127 [Hartmannibacter diazotrophicus]|uniref:UPF0301 protein HDIA_1127 n=2 Tax=Hartmannibacter diazotrophicus TaxID=1482074 RepID=A0A2C9D3D3_9HYPH|nr:YqgE/AlgH family protein [Hartmannibacter diazotrophicus]SON54668.1 hypothetical protein HDIA_1127 [Hartmannibacter diazotrophicus]